MGNNSQQSQLSALVSSLPHPDSVTNTQVDGLLRIVATMAGALAVTKQTGLEVSEPVLPENALLSVEATLIHACNRLDVLLTDSNRWNMKFQNMLEARSAELFAQQKEFFDAQTAAAEEVISPHFRYRPDLKKLPGGLGWLAYLGDPVNAPENSILGIGNSPNAALLAFDEMFKGTLPSNMMQWLAEREAYFLNPPIEKPNEQNKLDPGINRKTRRSPKSRKDS